MAGLPLLPSILIDNPQLQSIWFGLRRLIQSRRVVAIVSDQRLICAWEERGIWHWRSGAWPLDCLRDGHPLQRDAIADLLAELLLDCDVVGAQLELVLPIQGCHWRVLDGVAAEQLIQSAELIPSITDLNLPLDVPDSYLAFAPCVDQTLVVGCSRSLLLAWIDVVEMADLPLRRVDWMVSSAQRGLMFEQQELVGDLAWVFEDASSCRLVVIRAGVPELDCRIPLDIESDLAMELRRRIAAWQDLSGSSSSLVWCLCLPKELLIELESLIDPDRGETTWAHKVPWTPVALTSEDEAQGLLTLERLSLLGMREDIY